jgi:hypothetical protein
MFLWSPQLRSRQGLQWGTAEHRYFWLSAIGARAIGYFSIIYAP